MANPEGPHGASQRPRVVGMLEEQLDRRLRLVERQVTDLSRTLWLLVEELDRTRERLPGRLRRELRSQGLESPQRLV